MIRRHVGTACDWQLTIRAQPAELFAVGAPSRLIKVLCGFVMGVARLDLQRDSGLGSNKDYSASKDGIHQCQCQLELLTE